MVVEGAEIFAGKSESVKEEVLREFLLTVCDVAMRNFLALECADA